jgi:O-acetylhomoserine/O-acetylserine sulfhydrylase
MAALEDGTDALTFISGAAAVMGVIMSLARAGDNVIVSTFSHAGTYHQFGVILPQLGIEARFCDTNDLVRVEQLIDGKTKFIFTESIANPKFAIADLELLAATTHRVKIPLLVDATFMAGGHFCQPGKWGADIVIHSSSKWIGGHGTTLGGVVIETGRSDWQTNVERFPQLHGMRPGREGIESNLYKTVVNRAYIGFLRMEILRDTGACISPYAAQQMFIGVETLSLRCERQANNTAILAHWLRAHPRIKGVRYLGFEEHPYHQLAVKYLQHGFGTVLTFEMQSAEGLKVVDAFELISNTTKVGDCKTVVGHHWSTSHRSCTKEENERMGVFEDLFRLPLGMRLLRTSSRTLNKHSSECRAHHLPLEM